MMRTAALLLACLAFTIAAAPVTRAQYLMGTVCEISAESPQQIEAAFAEGRRVEALLSTWREDSELAGLNRAGTATLSPELFALLGTALSYSRETGDAFSPLMRPLVDAWQTRGRGANPSSAEITAAVARTASDNATLSEGRVELRNGAAFEEGAFGKGYAIDRMLALLGPHAVVNFGGQIGVRGAREVLVADPQNRDRAVVRFVIRDASLSTSSGSEKAFGMAGRRFTHIIDPRTGQALPPRGSASAVAADGLSADILSTALYVMGPDAGLRWADAHATAALFITASHEIRASAEFRRNVTGLQVLDSHFTLED